MRQPREVSPAAKHASLLRRCTLRTSALAAWLVVPFVCIAARGEPPEFIPLGFLQPSAPGRHSQAAAVSADGTVVVGYSASSGRTEAFRWTVGAGMQGLGYFSGGQPYSIAQSLSDDGSIIVGSGDPAAGGSPVFTWTPQLGIQHFEGFSPVPDPWYVPGFFVASDGRSIAGTVWSADGATRFEAARWTADCGMQRLGFLSNLQPVIGSMTCAISADGSTVVGVGDSSDPDPQFQNMEAFRWTPSRGLTGLGYLGPSPSDVFFSGALAVSIDGSTVVGFTTSTYGQESFRWTANGGMRSLGNFPGVEGQRLSCAQGVSADGSAIVGWSVVFTSTSNNSVGFLWTPTRGMRSIGTVLSEIGVTSHSGWNELVPTAISPDARSVVGYGIDPAGYWEAWLVHLPEFCAADFDHDGFATGGDFDDFAGMFEAGDISADFNADGFVAGDDFDAYVTAFESGC